MHEHTWSNYYEGDEGHQLALVTPAHLPSCANSLMSPCLLLEYSDDDDVGELLVIDTLDNADNNESQDLYNPALDSESDWD
jgi:hypothetical protein